MLLDPAAEVELKENEKNRVTIAAVLQLPVKHALVTAWFRVNRIFSNPVHFRIPAPSYAKVRTAFLQLSELLYGRVAPYFATHAELDQLLSLDTPSSMDIERARSLLVRPTQRHYFFTHLEHRAWLGPLADAGYFSTPPDLVASSDSHQRAQPWPEGQFLIKVAGQEPVPVH